MKQLYVEGYGVALRIRKGLLVITDKDGNKMEVGLADIDQVVIAGGGVSITSRVVQLLIENNIDLVFMDLHGQPMGRVYPPYVNRTVETRRRQYRAYDTEIGGYIAKEIVSAKLYNQAGHLRRIARNTGDDYYRRQAYRITGIAEEIDTLHGKPDEIRDRLRNIEARAARIYWDTLTRTIPGELGFASRETRGARDPVNMALNYTYSLLYRDAWKALVLAGLDPYAGYIHVDRSGHPTLVYDFVELFRASLVDYPLLSAIRNRRVKLETHEDQLTYRTRRQLLEKYRESKERKATVYGEEALPLGKHVMREAFKLARFLRGEARYRAFREVW